MEVMLAYNIETKSDIENGARSQIMGNVMDDYEGSAEEGDILVQLLLVAHTDVNPAKNEQNEKHISFQACR